MTDNKLSTIFKVGDVVYHVLNLGFIIEAEIISINKQDSFFIEKNNVYSTSIEKYAIRALAPSLKLEIANLKPTELFKTLEEAREFMDERKKNLENPDKKETYLLIKKLEEELLELNESLLK